MIQAVVLARNKRFLRTLNRKRIHFFNVTTDFPAQPIKATNDQIRGPVLSLDLGTKRVGIAVSDPTIIAVSRLPAIQRSSWKNLVNDLQQLMRRFDVKTIVIGLPLSLDGKERSASNDVRDAARKLALTVNLPVYLQDERLTSVEAETNLQTEGLSGDELKKHLDSEAAAVILRDFLGGGQQKILVERP